VSPQRASRHDVSSRFCSSWCESRAAQRLPPQPPPGLVPTTVGPAPAAADTGEGWQATAPGNARHEPSATVADHRPGRPALYVRESLEGRVLRALSDAGLAEEWGAGQALDIAATIDGGVSGSARAALHRELRAVMGDLMRGVNDPSSRVGRLRDELAERRARRAGGA
jgi:hypothetical protein